MNAELGKSRLFTHRQILLVKVKARERTELRKALVCLEFHLRRIRTGLRVVVFSRLYHGCSLISPPALTDES